MSTRSRANPWFRQPGYPTLEPNSDPDDDAYSGYGAAITRALVRSRLDNKYVLRQRMLDPAYDEKVRILCPELPPLDPQTVKQMRRIVDGYLSGTPA